MADPKRTVDGFKALRIPALLAARWLSFNVVVLAISLAIAIWHLTLLKEPGTDFVALDASDDSGKGRGVPSLDPAIRD